mmetsp:Transcript_23183/g.54981  ORF Transcript_23183/g.54981 Transcript_23183/m.54981 type:complete len:212 (-) Transcript_23183:569-1204(-)
MTTAGISISPVVSAVPGFQNRILLFGKSRSTSNISSNSIPIIPSTGSCAGSICSCGKSVITAFNGGNGNVPPPLLVGNFPQHNSTPSNSTRGFEFVDPPAANADRRDLLFVFKPRIFWRWGVISSVVNPESTMNSNGPCPWTCNFNATYSRPNPPRGNFKRTIGKSASNPLLLAVAAKTGATARPLEEAAALVAPPNNRLPRNPEVKTRRS